MSFKILDEYLFCPLCNKIRQLCRVSWLHTWKRCEYCLIKLPTKMIPTLATKG